MKKYNIFKNGAYHEFCDCRACIVKDVRISYSLQGFLIALSVVVVLVMLMAVVGTPELKEIIMLNQ